MRIHLLYATETGTAEMLCEDLEEALDGHECTIGSLGDADPGALDPGAFHIFVASTYGSGDLPVTAQPFCEAIEARSPDLGGLRFAVFGLGDMVFEATFANGSKILMDTLIAQGAVMIGERGIHDASSPQMPEDVAIPWAEEILPVAEAAMAEAKAA